MDFRRGLYYDSSTPNPRAATDFLSCTRASTGYAKSSSGTWTSFASNVLRVTDLGLLVEDARTNNLLNSDAPATQTTASLATGSYTLWVEGSGSALVSAGSASITGAASVTENNPDTFTVTVAGTVTVTITGSLTRFQLELGSFPSSFILTAGAAATRAADAVTCIGNLNTITSGTAASFAFDLVANDTSRNVTIFSPAVVNWFSLNAFSAGTQLDSNIPGEEITTVIGNSLTIFTGVKAALSFNASGRSIVGGGGTVATGTVSASHADYRLDADAAGARPISGYYRRLSAWNSRLADATLQALTAP